MKDLWKKFKHADLIKNLSFVGISDILGVVISSGFWLYIATIINETEYGEISYFIAIAGMSSSFALLGAENTLIVYTAKKVKIQSVIFFIVSIIALITSIVLFIIFQSLEISIILLGYIICGLAVHEIIGRQWYKTYTKYLIAQRVLMVGLSLGLYEIIGLNGLLLGIGFSHLIYVIRIFQIFREVKVDFTIFKKYFRGMMYNYSLKIGDAVAGNIDKIIIAPVFGFAILGNYQLGLQILAILEMIPAIIYKYTLPQDATGNINKKLKIITILTSIFLAIIGYFVSPILLPIIFPEHENIMEVTQIMIFVIIPVTIGLMYQSKFLGQEKTKIVLGSQIIFAAVLIPNIFLLGELWGYSGIIIALLISHSVHVSFLALADKYMK